MAGKYGSASVTCSYDDGGGVARNVVQFILDLGGVKITQNSEESHAFGDAWAEATPVGVGKVDDIELSGFWDTTATTGPHVVFLTPDADPNGTLRTLLLGFGDSKTFTVETRLISYEVTGSRGNLTKFKAVARPSGTPTWA